MLLTSDIGISIRHICIAMRSKWVMAFELKSLTELLSVRTFLLLQRFAFLHHSQCTIGRSITNCLYVSCGILTMIPIKSNKPVEIRAANWAWTISTCTWCTSQWDSNTVETPKRIYFRKMRMELLRSGKTSYLLYQVRSLTTWNRFHIEHSEVDYLDTYKAMEKLIGLGLVRSIGVSNFNSEQIDRLLANCTIKPVTNQIEIGPSITQKKLIKFCKDRDIVITGFSPLGRPYASELFPNAPQLAFLDQRVIDIGNKYGKTGAQVVLRYLVGCDKRKLFFLCTDRKPKFLLSVPVGSGSDTQIVQQAANEGEHWDFWFWIDTGGCGRDGNIWHG